MIIFSDFMLLRDSVPCTAKTNTLSKHENHNGNIYFIQFFVSIFDDQNWTVSALRVRLDREEFIFRRTGATRWR